MKTRKLLILLWMFLLSANSVVAKSWRGVEPLHSTRADVERILGSTVVRCSAASCIYDLGEETVFVLYATGSTCKNDDATTRWNVPAGTVLEIGVHFKEDIPFSQLPFNLSEFEKIYDKELPGLIYYLNLEEGLRIEGGLQTASSVTYFQSKKDNHLRCAPPRQSNRL